jgi:hypothetical protein
MTNVQSRNHTGLEICKSANLCGKRRDLIGRDPATLVHSQSYLDQPWSLAAVTIFPVLCATSSNFQRTELLVLPEYQGRMVCVTYFTELKSSTIFTADRSCIYLAGNSLGALSKRSEMLVQEELHVWATA